MVRAERGIQSARQATVSIWDRSKETAGHCGHGLLLPVGVEEAVVLTCHHVIAPIAPQDLCVRVPQEDGSLSAELAAHYDAEGSSPKQDAALLRLNIAPAETRPLLHSLSLDSYDSALPVTVLTHLVPDNFNAEIRASTRLNLEAMPSEARPVPEGRYELRAFRLSDSTDTRPGVSGGVAVCDGGVLGLVHFAREEGSTHARECYLMPLDVWSDQCTFLKEFVEPFVDANLRSAAVAKRSSELEVGTNLVIAQYREDVYLERGLKEQANAALSQGGALMVVGRPKSGKSRLVWEILRDRPETLIVAPHPNALPPTQLEAAGWENRDIIVVFDDLHRVADTAQPLRWWRQLSETTRASCYLICTTRDGKDWDLVKDKQETFLELLGGAGTVYTSRIANSGVERGEDLSLEQGQSLASDLSMDEQEFPGRFDGTPGSLLLDLADMGRRYEALRQEHIGGVSASRLLDSGKLLHQGGQSDLTERKLRLVAEKIRGETQLSTEVWEMLQRRTLEEGFGVFDAASTLQIYRPYLEQCVSYRPTREELRNLIEVLEELEDAFGLLQLGATYAYDLEEGESALECVDKALELQMNLPEAWFARAVQLSDLKRGEDALEAYDEALRLRPYWPEAYVNKGMVLNGLHLHNEAREAFEQAIAMVPDLPEAWLGKGVSLSSIEHHRKAAEAFQEAIDRRPEYPPAWHNRGVELGALGKHEEALQAYEVATHLKPDYGLAWYSKGNTLLELSQYSEALQAYDRALTEGYDRDHEVLFGKGNAQLRLGQYRDAIQSYEAAIQREPDYYEAWHQMGIALDTAGDREKALSAFDKAMTLQPDSATSLNSKALVLFDLDRFTEALETADLALTYDTNAPEILSLKCAVLREMRRNDEALAAVERAIQTNPNEPELWSQKGAILHDLGRFAEERVAFSKAFLLRSRLSPRDP